MGMMICNDRRWPEVYRVMGLQGVELIVLGYNTPSVNSQLAEEGPERRLHHSELVMTAGAYQNATWVVGVAKAGVEDGHPLMAGTVIVDPDGFVVARAGGEGDEVVVHPCDMDACAFGKETIFDFGRHRRVEHYGLITSQTGVVRPRMSAIDLAALAPRDRYKLLTAIVIPRPVAWVTTVDAAGVVNAAPLLVLQPLRAGPGARHPRPGAPARRLGQGHHAQRRGLGRARRQHRHPRIWPRRWSPPAAAYPPGVGEPAALGLATAPSTKVAPPRLADAPAAIECRRVVSLAFSPEREIVVAEAVALHAREGLVDLERMHVEWGGDLPVARLFADRYARLVEIERRAIPEPKEATA